MHTKLRGVIAATSFAVVVTGLAFTARALALAPQDAVQAADLVLTNGKIVTVEEGAPEAQAIASAAGRIVAVGSNAAIKKHIGPNTEVIDLQGQLVIPGFIEGHGHFNGIGNAELGLK